MKKTTPGEEVPASPHEPVRELTPQDDAPTMQGVRKITLHIGGKRYEFSHHMEVRELVKGPARVIEMPPRTL